MGIYPNAITIQQVMIIMEAQSKYKQISCEEIITKY
jgi:hypothetical protein